MTEAKLMTVSVVKALSDALIEAIFNLEYKPGQQITEAELASRYNVSRNTVREAIVGLISSGLLEKHANKGVFVKAITESDVRDIFHFRALLESEAMRFIIRNDRRIPPELYASVEKLEQDPHISKKWYEYVSADLNFHFELVRASNSERLVRLYDTIRLEIMLCLCQSKNQSIVNPQNFYEHSQFLYMLETGSEEKCSELIVNHITYGIENVARGFD